MAKEKDVDYRKLLYTLKSIGFRLSERSKGRLGWYISFNNLSFFEEIYHLIKQLWELEENHKYWIEFFKDQKGWEKSRITNFMKRRIKYKIVPSYFFNIPPKFFPPEFVSCVIKKDKDIIKLFDILKSIAADQELPNHQQLKEELRKICSGKFTSLLTAGKK